MESVNQSVVQEQNKTRICSTCRVEKDLKSEFYKQKSERSGYAYYCKKCVSEIFKKRKNDARPLDYIGKKYPNSHLTILEDKGTANQKRQMLVQCDCGYKKIIKADRLKTGSTKSCGRLECEYSSNGKKNKESVMLEDKEHGFLLLNDRFEKIKRGAKDRKLSFNLTPEDMLDLWKKQEGKCYYTGMKLTISKFSKDSKSNTWSIDRIDNDRGYQKDNVIIVHKALNMMRGTMSIKSFITAAHLIANHYDRQKEKVLSISEEQINDMFRESTLRIAMGKNKTRAEIL